MNEETEILISKAAAGELTAVERKSWEALCGAQPELRQEADAIRRLSENVRAGIERAETRARAEIPEEMPEYLLGRLETARREVFGNAGSRSKSPGLWQRLQAWLKESTHLPMPVLAGIAVLLVAAVGWMISQDGNGSGGGAPTIATLPPIFKEAVASRDLPVVAPGAETHLSDPDVTWMSLRQEPVQVNVLDENGTILAEAEAARPPLAWATLTASGQLTALQPGVSYLFRLRQGSVVSERVVRVLPDAGLLADAAARPDALETAQQWLESGHAGDALTLATRLAARLRESGQEPSAEITQLREAALAAALSAEQPTEEK